MLIFTACDPVHTAVRVAAGRGMAPSAPPLALAAGGAMGGAGASPLATDPAVQRGLPPALSSEPYLPPPTAVPAGPPQPLADTPPVQKAGAVPAAGAAGAAVGPTGPALAMRHVLVLEYHTLTREASSDNPYAVPVDAFSRQMAALAASHIPVISARELAGRLATGRGLDSDAVVITFDDGYEPVYLDAAPILARYRLPYTLFLIGQGVRADGPASADPKAHLTVAELRQMAQGGLADLESHTWNLHAGCALLCASPEQISADLGTEDGWLGALSGTAPVAFAYPRGGVDRAALDIVRARYRVAFVGPTIPAEFAAADLAWLYPRWLVYPNTDLRSVLTQFFVSRHPWFAE